jgi:MFS family permease
MASPTPSLSITQAWFIVAAISILICLTNIDYTAVNLALVSISDHVDADLNTLQWLLSAYVLTWAAFVIPGSKLADIYGRRNMLILGIGFFILGSLIDGTWLYH